jgi:hypothetical protein
VDNQTEIVFDAFIHSTILFQDFDSLAKSVRRSHKSIQDVWRRPYRYKHIITRTKSWAIGTCTCTGTVRYGLWALDFAAALALQLQTMVMPQYRIGHHKTSLL